MIRIVADTNVLISALIWKQRLQAFSDLLNKRKIILCFSPETLEELNRVTRYSHVVRKIQKDQIDMDKILDALVGASLIVYPKGAVHVITADPSDNKFLESAIKAKAHAIVSGDKHLLKLKSFSGIPILTPAQFLKRF